MSKGNLNIKGNMMREFAVSFPEIIINGNFRVVPHTTKYFKSLGTAYLNRYHSIRNIYRNKHKVAIIDTVSGRDYSIMSEFGGCFYRRNLIMYADNTKIRYSHRLSRFK